MARSVVDDIRNAPAALARGFGIEPYPLPPPDFDPWSARDEDLRSFGLPTPMAMPNNPAATAFRRAFLQRRPGGPPLSFMYAQQRTAAAPPVGVRPIAAITTQPVQKSVNWSGGYVVPRDGRSFASVMANWTVTTVSPPFPDTATEYQSSTWIGLDGQKFYSHSSLPQIGTRQKCDPNPTPNPEYKAWFQWWARGRDTPPEDLALPVSAGDEISAIITVLDETTVRCNLKNVTQDIVLQAFNAFAPAGLRISGATAQWIMERPSPIGSDGWDAYELPVYTPFAFTGCVAESLAPGSEDLHDHGLDGARLIRMYELTGYPMRTRTISTARRILGPPQAMELTYVAP